MEDGIPYILSVKGYGVYWDNYSPVRFTDNQQGTTFESTVGNSVDYYFMRGNNADGVVAQMRELTGQVPMFPLWTYGFWQSRERYKSQAELLEVVTKYRELGVPIDGIIQDWQYWGNNYGIHERRLPQRQGHGGASPQDERPYHSLHLVFLRPNDEAL